MTADAAGSVDDALTADHERLDGVLQALARSLPARPGETAALLAEFEQGLFPHMTWEEEALFPALLAAGYPAHRVEGLIIDHRRIREALAELHSRLDGGDLARAAAAAEQVRIYLVGHNGDEEKILYPDADRLLPADQRRRLLKLWTLRFGSA